MPHKILVVDDERVGVALVKFGLKERRFDVFTAFDGDEGLKKVKEVSPDLIVLDVQMPNMNGYEFMTELKQMNDFKNTPVIMLTGNETMEDVFRHEGVKAYFVKPVDLVKLVDKVKECLHIESDEDI